MGRERRPGETREELQRLIERALQLLQSGDATGAEQLLRQCWDARDAEWSARAGLHLGELWLRRGRPADAIAILREAIDTWGHPMYGAQAMITLGVALAGMGDIDGAERQYRTVIQIAHPLMGNVARFNLAELCHRRARTDEAVTLYREVAASGHPEMAPRAGVNLGVLYSELGQWELAHDAFSQVAASGHAQQAELARRNLVALEQASSVAQGPAGSDEQSATSALRAGQELEARRDLAGAERYYRLADQLGSGEAASNLGALLFERGDVAAAEAALRRADQRRDPTGTFRLGFLLEETGRAAEAVAVYTQAAALGNVSAMKNLGHLLRRTGDLDGARIAYAQLLASTTDQSDAAMARRVLASLSGEPPPRPVPPASFHPEASAVDSLLWIAGDPKDDRVQRARAFVLSRLEPPLRGQLAALIQSIDAGAITPSHVSIAPYAQALLAKN